MIAPIKIRFIRVIRVLVFVLKMYSIFKLPNRRIFKSALQYRRDPLTTRCTHRDHSLTRAFLLE
jgi:hypothetical protein